MKPLRLCMLGLITLPAAADFADGQRFGPGRNDFGEAGLMQTPTARMAPTGEFSLHLSRVRPYDRYTLSLQPVEWMELAFGYSRIGNRNLRSDQSRKDKLAHIKLRLLKERRYRPAIAIGVRDAGGTGLFASEYMVANKRFGDLDISLGLGWGQLSNRQAVSNPLIDINQKFSDRGDRRQFGGNFETDDWFRGSHVGVFGGVDYHFADRRWRLKLEYDSNDYQHEALGNNQDQASPINVGASYRYSNAVEFQLGFERGNTAMLGITLRSNLNQLKGPVKKDHPKIAPKRDPVSWKETGQRLNALNLSVDSITRIEETVVIRTSQKRYKDAAEAVERIGRVADNSLPTDIERIAVIQQDYGLDTRQFIVQRDALSRFTGYQANTVELDAPEDSLTGGETVYQRLRSRLDTAIEPYLIQSIGGPDDFYLFQVNLGARASWWFTESTELVLLANAPLFGNYDNFEFRAPSGLPRVRTDINRYINDTDLGIGRLQLTHMWQTGSDWFAQVYGGYLETMFAGVGGEILYRPGGSGFAVGLDLNHVRQRDFDGGVGFRDYDATTGHLTSYFQPFPGIHTKLSAGRYLAGDNGVGIDVSKRFDSGVEVGAFANFTDATSEDFGEGSFNKGFYFIIPTDLLYTTPRNGVITLPFTPLVRDGGQPLVRHRALYDVTGGNQLRPREIRGNGPNLQY